MSPIFRARDAYGTERNFEQDLHAHLVHGVVVSTPSLFIMARPVQCAAEARLLANIRFAFQRPDCWFVWSAAGPLTALLALIPYELPYVAFHRRRDPRLRVLSTARLRALARCRCPHRSLITPPLPL